MATTSVPAIVTYAPDPSIDMRYEEVELQTSLKNHKVLIQMVATGVCHLEILMASSPPGVRGSRYPRILGHEGAGYVRAVGHQVTAVKVGDAVVLSYCYCGTCGFCRSAQLSCCMDFGRLNMVGDDAGEVFSREEHGVVGKFFGQSSFASLSVVDESCVVDVTGLIENEIDLKLFGPLGCGFQTGAGAVTIAGQAQSDDIVVVAGAGAVGLGAIMAAKVARCKVVVAVDRVPSRLDLATRVGATHVLDTTGVVDIGERIKQLVGNAGRISLVVETTGVSSVITALVNCIGYHGRYIQLGVSSSPATSLSISIDDLVRKRVIIEGVSEGSAVAREFIPKMIGWYREGKFPIDTLIECFPAKEVSAALRGMEDGSVVKPVLLW